MQDVRTHQEWARNQDVQWQDTICWILFSRWMQWENLEDHILAHTWPTDVNKYASIVGRLPRARGLGVMTLP